MYVAKTKRLADARFPLVQMFFFYILCLFSADDKTSQKHNPTKAKIQPKYASDTYSRGQN